ncbi:Hypothetical_protein [Hexamita inflata]|uniref:Hypothetical_protein n=1 Tax=Hexamita inflata TaxID=28002 RepID=A0AA86TVP4_9EUKA|nr:Hypothetical protein HINF_LOCUS18360 [Hexamita inflata]
MLGYQLFRDDGCGYGGYKISQDKLIIARIANYIHLYFGIQQHIILLLNQKLLKQKDLQSSEELTKEVWRLITPVIYMQFTECIYIREVQSFIGKQSYLENTKVMQHVIHYGDALFTSNAHRFYYFQLIYNKCHISSINISRYTISKFLYTCIHKPLDNSINFIIESFNKKIRADRFMKMTDLLTY